jgi:hypothetical protein
MGRRTRQRAPEKIPRWTLISSTRPMRQVTHFCVGLCTRIARAKGDEDGNAHHRRGLGEADGASHTGACKALALCRKFDDAHAKFRTIW